MFNKTNELITKLASTKTDENLFNPYNQICKFDDISTAPGIRQGNLRLYLDRYVQTKTEVLWLFDYADYHSSKKSGIPMVEPFSYKNIEEVLGLSIHFENAGKNSSMRGAHAFHTKVWDLMSTQRIKPLVWNVLPFYPHTEDDLMTERTPTNAEYQKYAEYLDTIITVFKPTSIRAVGKTTKNVLSFLGVNTRILVI